METTATIKGQIVIPAVIRRKLGVKNGTRINVKADEKAHQIILTPITREYIYSLKGKYKGLGLLKTLMEERKRDWEKEEKI